jgi:phosphorylcholine metabolism protein LicD
LFFFVFYTFSIIYQNINIILQYSHIKHIKHNFTDNLVELSDIKSIFEPKYNSNLTNYIDYSYKNWYNSDLIPRGITIKEHVEMMSLLDLLDKLFRKNGIRYMISEGTLLGSWRHHDIIPWDDDLVRKNLYPL